MALSVSASASFQQTTLDNGLRVILREVRERPLVGAWMWYRVGGRNELPGTTGVSHWVEHMLFKGGKRFGKGEITKEVSRRGGALNAFTWIDCTAYYLTLPSSEIDLALAIESDRIYDTRIEPEEAEAERSVVISEREGSENYPEFWLREEVQAVAWREHPYRLGVIGPKSDLRAMTREDLYAHYKRYYMTNNASLVIVGDFDTQQLLEKIHAEFDAYPAGPAPAPLQHRRAAADRRAACQRASTGSDPLRHAGLPRARSQPRGRGGDGRAELDPGRRIEPDRLGRRTRAGTQLAPVSGDDRRRDRQLGLGWLRADTRSLSVFDRRHTARGRRARARGSRPPATKSNASSAKACRTMSWRGPDASCTPRWCTRSKASPTRASRWASWTWSRTIRPAWETFPEALQSVTSEDVQRVARTYLVERQRTTGWFVPDNEDAFDDVSYLGARCVPSACLSTTVWCCCTIAPRPIRPSSCAPWSAPAPVAKRPTSTASPA